MPEAHTDMDWFQHFHQAATNELIIIIEKEARLSQEDAGRLTNYPTQEKLVDNHIKTLDTILSNLKEEKPEPASVLRKGLAALSEIDKERFLIENLLEAVKRGDSLRKTVSEYHNLGLTDIKVSDIPAEEDVPVNSGAGQLLWRLLNNLKKVATKVIQLFINAMKAMPKFIGIKPSIGFSGPFPMLSLQFNLEMESLTLHDLFQDLTQGLWSEKPPQ